MHPAVYAFLHAHGVDVPPVEIEAALAEALDQHRAILYPLGASGLTADEAAVLKSGGFDLQPRDLGRSDPLLRSMAEHAAILKSTLTTAQVAELLGVTEGRVRQRLQKRTLYGIDGRHGWKVPSFQFTEEGELPGWAEVAPRLPADLSPVELLGWLTLPNPDLGTGPDEAATSPRDWLLTGGNPRAVADLAGDLA